MLRVAIVDDDENDLKNVEEIALDFFNSINIDYEIKVFSNGNDLLNSTISFDLILLDIEMKQMNGIEVAKSIRKYNRDTKIVFITNSTNYLQIGYTVNADRYLVKPLNKVEFNYEISNILNNNFISNKFILDERIGPFKLYLNDIIYIEFYDRKTIVHKKDEMITTTLTLKEWLSLLDKYHFSQNHKAFITNLNYVKLLHTNSLVLYTNEELLLSRKFKAKFKADYYTLIGERV